MKTNRSLLLHPALLVAFALTSGCGGDEPAETGSSPASPAASTAAGGSTRPVEQVDTDVREIDDYRLTMDAVERWHDSQRIVYRRVRADPTLADQARLDADFSSLDEFEHELSSTPLFREAIAEAGLEPREFVLISFALFQAEAVNQAMDEGVSRDSILAQSSLHPDNLDFARQHRARLERLQEETRAVEPPELGGD